MTISPVTKLPLQRLHFPILRACDQSREPSRQRSPASISVEIWSPGQISPSEPLERNVQALKREEDVHSTARAVRSARSKWHRRREAAGREGNFTAPFPELRGSLPERRHEPRVASVKILACRLGQGMEERRRRLLGALRSLVRLLALNGGNPENLASRSLALRRGVRLDLRDQIGGEPSLSFYREVLRRRGAMRPGRTDAMTISPVTKLPLQRLHFPFFGLAGSQVEPSRQRSLARFPWKFGRLDRALPQSRLNETFRP